MEKAAQRRDFMAEFGPRSINCQLVERAWGKTEGKACALREGARSDGSAVPAPSIPRHPGQTAGELAAIAKGGASNTAIVPSPALPQAQLDYLKRNAVSLQPETRKIGAANAAEPTNPLSGVGSTFLCGTPPNQYACPASIEPRRTEPSSGAVQPKEARATPGPFAPASNQDLAATRRSEIGADVTKQKTERPKYLVSNTTEDCGSWYENVGRRAQCQYKGGGKLCTKTTTTSLCDRSRFLGRYENCTLIRKVTLDVCKTGDEDKPKEMIERFCSLDSC
jgi:hypothetical protein